MTFQLPEIKPPSWNIPAVRNLPMIPKVGCVSGNATTQIGEQMANFPDIQALPHIKALNKVITEQIGTLLEGKLPDAPRAIVYEVRKARLITELADIISKGAELAGQFQAEVNAAIEACNAKINDLNQAQAALLQIPENARSVIQDKMISRYNEYIGEINGQIGRLQQSLGCLN